MSHITLRRATEHDFVALDALYYATHEYHVAGVPARLRSLGPLAQWDRDSFHTALRHIFANEDAGLWLAKVDGVPAGMIETYFKSGQDDPLLLSRNYVDVQNIFVLSTFRKQGVGRHLMAVAEDCAHAKGAAELCLSVWAFNILAQNFYADLGFEPITYNLAKKVAESQ